MSHHDFNSFCWEKITAVRLNRSFSVMLNHIAVLFKNNHSMIFMPQCCMFSGCQYECTSFLFLWMLYFRNAKRKFELVWLQWSMVKITLNWHPSLSCEHNISGTLWGNFLNLAHKSTWTQGQTDLIWWWKVKVTVTSHNTFFLQILHYKGYLLKVRTDMDINLNLTALQKHTVQTWAPGVKWTFTHATGFCQQKAYMIRHLSLMSSLANKLYHLLAICSMNMSINIVFIMIINT